MLTKTENEMMTNYFYLCKAYWDVSTETEANEAIKKVDAFCKRFETGDNFVSYLGIALLERIKKRMEKRDGTGDKAC